MSTPHPARGIRDLPCLRSKAIPDDDVRRDKILKCLHYLPVGNHCLLHYLLYFLTEIAEHSDENKVSTRSLVVRGVCTSGADAEVP